MVELVSVRQFCRRTNTPLSVMFRAIRQDRIVGAVRDPVTKVWRFPLPLRFRAP